MTQNTSTRRPIHPPPWAALLDQPRFLIWRYEDKGGPKPAKVPYSPRDTTQRASVTDPATWATFGVAHHAYSHDATMAGIGYVLTTGDPAITAIDLDHAVDSKGTVAAWAAPIVAQFETYTELSPSETGVHLFLNGKKPAYLGSKSKVNGVGSEGTGGVEVYDDKRYVAITGWPISGFEHLADRPMQPRQQQLDALCALLWPEVTTTAIDSTNAPTDSDEAAKMIASLTANIGAIEMVKREIRARHYVAVLPPAVSGQGGHDATFRAACEAYRFGLTTDAAWTVLKFYNDKQCFPGWSNAELRHKLRQARRAVLADHGFGARLATAPRRSS